MNFLVIDASVALAWALADEDGPLANHVMARMGETVFQVPGHWHLEVMNSLLTAERRGRIEPEGTAFAVHLFQQIDMLIDPWTSSHAMGTSYFLAAKHRLTLYDAAYLELALRLGHPLATLDQKLAKAAEEEGVVIVKIES